MVLLPILIDFAENSASLLCIDNHNHIYTADLKNNWVDIQGKSDMHMVMLYADYIELKWDEGIHIIMIHDCRTLPIFRQK